MEYRNYTGTLTSFQSTRHWSMKKNYGYLLSLGIQRITKFSTIASVIIAESPQQVIRLSDYLAKQFFSDKKETAALTKRILIRAPGHQYVTTIKCCETVQPGGTKVRQQALKPSSSRSLSFLCCLDELAHCNPDFEKKKESNRGHKAK